MAEASSTVSYPSTLEEWYPYILDKLREGIPKTNIEGYESPPFVKKATWTALGDAIKVAEKTIPVDGSIPGERYASLRLDGKNFSKITRVMRSAGILGDGYSEKFAAAMQESCLSVMELFNGVCAYTQSDEMTILVPCASVVRGVQQPHFMSGRVMKWCSIAASQATAVFNARIASYIRERDESNGNKDGNGDGKVEKVVPLALFDCRVGTYTSLETASLLVLWRAYDCSVNGLSDACYHLKGKVPGAKNANGYKFGQKIEFLKAAGVLPLPVHQTSGSYYLRVKKMGKGYNPKTKEEVVCMRSVVEKVDCNSLLKLAITSPTALLPPPTSEQQEIVENPAKTAD
mgnify:CR=1 FL=1